MNYGVDVARKIDQAPSTSHFFHADMGPQRCSVIGRWGSFDSIRTAVPCDKGSIIVGAVLNQEIISLELNAML